MILVDDNLIFIYSPICCHYCTMGSLSFIAYYWFPNYTSDIQCHCCSN